MTKTKGGQGKWMSLVADDEDKRRSRSIDVAKKSL